MDASKPWFLFLFMVVIIFKGVQGQVSTSIAPLLSLSGIGSNLPTSCLTNPTTADRAAAVQAAVPAIPSTVLSSLSAFGLPGLITTASGVFCPSATHNSGLPTLHPCKIDSKLNPSIFKALKQPDTTTSDLDKDVLNNLAIALQLLIVSNLIKAPNNELETGKEIPIEKLLYLNPSTSSAPIPSCPIKTSTPSTNTRSPIPITSIRLLCPANSAQSNMIPPLNAASVSPLPTRLTNIPGSLVIAQPAVHISQRTHVHNAPTTNPGIQAPMLQHVQYIQSPHTQSATSPVTSQVDSLPDAQLLQCDRERSMHYMRPYATASSSIPESPSSTLPNANFIGTSNFDSPFPKSILNPMAIQSSRSLNIMSPYDSIASISPQADAFPALSLNGMTNSDKDFQFPYCTSASDDGIDDYSKNIY